MYFVQISGKEAKVKEYIDAELRQNEKLAERVFDTFITVQRVMLRLCNGKRVITEKLSLPGYILVQANMNSEVASITSFYT